MRTEKEIKGRISDIKKIIDDTKKELSSDIRITVENINEMLSYIEDLKTRIGILEWVLNENEKFNFEK